MSAVKRSRECEISLPLAKFKIAKVLNTLTDKKTIFLHVHAPDSTNNSLPESNGVMILEKTPFNVEFANEFIHNGKLLNDEGKLFENDVYSTNHYVCSSGNVNSVKTTLIHPATERQILKYMSQERFLVEESGDVYRKIVKPFMEKQSSSTQWVVNILEHKSENERIIFEDPDMKLGFILLPDMRWDTKDLSQLHLLAICHRRDLPSIRDLTADHIPLLQNILARSYKAIHDKFDLSRGKIRAFIHYQPTFYHLHIHFTAVSVEGTHVACERAHLVSDVIQNLQLSEQYYHNRTMTYLVSERDPLLASLREEGVITEMN